MCGSLMHAAGHTILAAAGGGLARSLAGAGPQGNARSIATLATLGGGDVVIGLAIAGLFAAIAKLVGGVVAGRAEARVAGSVGASLRLEVLDRVLGVHTLRRARHGDHGSAEPSRNLAALTTHVKAVENGVARGVFAELRAVMQLAPLGLLLVVLAPRLAMSAVCALAAFALLVMSARRAIKRGHVRAARESELLLGAADEAVKHADLWATYGAEEKVRAHVAGVGRRIVETNATLRARAALLSGTSEVLGALALVLTLALVGAGAIAGVERGEIVPFAIAFFMAYRPLRDLVEGRLARTKGESAHADVNEEDAGVRGRARERESTRAWGRAELVIDGAVAAFGDHAPVTLRLGPGQIAAIVGPTGVGKTSLLRALLGLDALRAGSVRWGAEEISTRGVGPTERPFAWVPQDAPVLAETLRANVMLGGEARGDVEEILEALGAATLASMGDATLATERPVSGGERQWIAVARAMATRLPVLLLDEPTSALDAPAQTRMLRAIAKLRGKRTVLLVTHRTEPLAIADVVVTLQRREDAQERAGGHGDLRAAEQLAVEDVGPTRLVPTQTWGPVLVAEAQRETRREGVDAPAAE
ncbi:MAG: ABC transporter ATP-binding protein [Labilithrix sp.]|nr:ABC transporter ATP-binding protein [Labilithrix sp.]